MFGLGLFKINHIIIATDMLYRGIDKIEHRKPVKHYVQLFTGTVHTIQSSLVDDVVDLNAIEAPPVLAIEDVAEGEPEDIGDMVGNGGHRVGYFDVAQVGAFYLLVGHPR